MIASSEPCVRGCRVRERVVITPILALLAFAGLIWPAVFHFVFEARVRDWLGARWNDRIYPSGARGYWRSRAGRAVGHLQFLFLFGPTFAWIGLIVLVAMALRAAGVEIR
jgi:hypothetical protein